MSNPRLYFISILILAVSQSCTAQTRDELAKDPAFFLKSSAVEGEWNEPTEPTKLVGPIYYIGTKGLGSYLITTTEGHILLYTGMPGSGQLIEASVKKLGFKPGDIKYILTGHAHIDHVGGHAHMKKVSGAKVVMMSKEQELIESGGKTDFHYGHIPEFLFDAVKVDILINDGDTITLGDVTLSALLTPGHTKGTTTWITTVANGGRSYSVVFADGTSINPGYRLTGSPSYPGIADDFRKTLQRLDSLNPDIWFAPHPGVLEFYKKRERFATEGVKVWVDLEGYRKRLEQARKRFDEEVKR